MENSLIVDNIDYSYNKKLILKDITFTCTNGMVALLGNNGAGKTTLMSILAGLKKVKKGKVVLNGIDLLDTKDYPLQHVGYLPQNFNIYNNISGYDFLSFVYDLKKLNSQNKKQCIDEVIERFNLGSIIHKRIGKYSGGFKRRLGIAQAVIGKPALIIIDEPTVGLDPEQRVEFRSYLSEISKDSITIISTHIIEDVELFSDKIMILKDQSIKYNGTVKEIINDSSSNILTIETTISALSELKRKVVVLEEKRINTDLIKVRFIKNNYEINNSYRDKEISLENAYVYFQKI